MMEWNNVKITLPNHGVSVLVYSENDYDANYQEGFEIGYIIDGKWYTGKQQDELNYVTHWCPLPEKPKQ